MIVPKFWAEGRAQERIGKSQVTIRRFGWSDTSQQDAQLLADQRTQAAMTRARTGEKLPRREPKLAYNGADGVPIREEIVTEHGDTVITRNIYGALCLNTPDVLFADIDISNQRRVPTGCGFILSVAAAAIALVGWTSFPFAGKVFVASWLSLFILFTVFNAVSDRRYKNKSSIARRRLEKRLKPFSDWRIALYQTPAGFRVLVLHRLFKPSAPETIAFFNALRTDPTYVRMCRNQQCFRARVSPKPWRIGIPKHIRPRPGIWPINPDRLPDRRAWIENYKRASEPFASCRYLDTFGSGATNSKAAAVKKLHDDLSRAHSSLPIA